VIVFWIMRTLTVSSKLTGGSYTNQYALQFSAIAGSLVRWMGWLGRDFAYLLPLLVLALIWVIVRRRLPSPPFWAEATVWILAWIGLYLPWELMSGYYMMPVAVGLALLGGVLVEIGVQAWQEKQRWLRLTVGLMAVLSGLLFISGLFTFAANGRVQLAVDSANEQMAAYLAANADRNAEILLNIQYENDYRPELERRLALMGRSDLKVNTFAFQDVDPAESVYVITPLIENQPLLTVRMGVVEETQTDWNRKLEPYLAENAGQQTARFDQSFHLMMLNLPRLFCPLMPSRGFCTAEEPVLDLRPFSYGWEIYQLEKP